MQTQQASAEDLDSVATFFDQFDAAFSTFDGASIATRYAEPYTACKADGSAATFANREEIARYFQGLLDQYSSIGVQSCGHRDLQVTTVGAAHLLGTTTWDLFDDNGNVVTSWRESYLLTTTPASGLLVRTSIDQ